MDLICYLHPGWAPLIRPAPSTREWMDKTSHSFAYRCLPLNIANAHGWEVLSPITFDAIWDGRDNQDAIRFRGPPGSSAHQHPVSIFGYGVMTFHIEAVFRTPPGWNLWIGGPPNRFKDGIAALGGVMETDWTPFTFTMNWKFTRPNHWVHFEAYEPICQVFPVQRGALEHFNPRLEPMPDEPGLMSAYVDWSKARDEFQARVKQEKPTNPADTWQKHYYRGTDLAGKVYIDDHRTKLRLKAFDTSKFPDLPPIPRGRDYEPDEAEGLPAEPPADEAPALVAAGEAASPADALALKRREWLMDAIEGQRKLARRTFSLPRIRALTTEQFLELFYAANRPVIMVGEMEGWPLARLDAAGLKQALATKAVDLATDDAERAAALAGAAEPALKPTPADQFMRGAAKGGDGARWRLAADASARNARIVAPLKAGFGNLEKFLAEAAGEPRGVIEIRPAGSLQPLGWDPRNRLTAQAAGRRRFKLLPPSEAWRLYEAAGVFSQITDLDGQDVSLATYPLLEKARVYDVTLEAGEVLFLPLGWWRQARTLDLGVSLDYTAFRWPNGATNPLPQAAA
jgi:hypothetical protein